MSLTKQTKQSQDVISVYKCLCDLTRLRILNLLTRGPLCVCHLQDVLKEPQVKISKHLKYLRMHGLIVCDRRANWSVYSMRPNVNRLLDQNLKCLQDVCGQDPVFKEDLMRLESTDTSAACSP